MAVPVPLQAGDPDALRVLLAGHPFCAGLEVEHVTAMAGLASEHTFAPDSFLLRRGQPARTLSLLLEGDVSLEIVEPGSEAIVLETLHEGETVGWSWLYPPHRWTFDARCRSTVHLVQLDTDRLRDLMARDPALGRDLAVRVGQLVVQRLQLTRAQLVEIQHHDRP